MTLRLARATALLLLVGAPAQALAKPPGANENHDVAPSARRAAEAVDAFHAALAKGDSAAAAALLADDALIFESGGAERSKAEYAGHHLEADAQFSRAMTSVVSRRSGTAAGGFAWIASEGRTTGTYKGKAINLVTTETMVLRQTAGGWKIIHVHWSSATKR